MMAFIRPLALSISLVAYTLAAPATRQNSGAVIRLDNAVS